MYGVPLLPKAGGAVGLGLLTQLFGTSVFCGVVSVISILLIGSVALSLYRLVRGEQHTL